MHNDAVSRLIRLRHMLKESASAEVEDVLLSINLTMTMLLKRDVCIDLMSNTSQDSAVVARVASMTQSSQNISDPQLREHTLRELHGIMSACLSCTLLGSPHTQLPCNAMSMDERMQHMRSSLLLIL